MLRPGGRFAFAVWGPPEEQSSIGAFVQAVSQHHEVAQLPHGPLFGVTDRETLGTLVEAAGLEGFVLTSHDTVWECPTLDPVMDGFWTWGNLGGFPADKQASIRAAMEESCKPFGGTGGFKFPHSAILGRATKR